MSDVADWTVNWISDTCDAMPIVNQAYVAPIVVTKAKMATMPARRIFFLNVLIDSLLSIIPLPLRSMPEGLRERPYSMISKLNEMLNLEARMALVVWASHPSM